MSPHDDDWTSLPERPRSGALRNLWRVLLALAAVFLLVDPLGLHPLDEWLRHLGGGHRPAVGESDAPPAVKELWTCGMHPDVIQEEPGQCPICHMDLVPLEVESPAVGGASVATAQDGPREVLFYRNPMDPSVTSPVPAKDSMGMDYVPVYSDQGGPPADTGRPVVQIEPEIVQNMNVRTEPVARRDLAHSIRTVGYLDYDQGRMVTVTTKFAGFVERVYINYVGEPVVAGRPLFEIYSPELVQTQQELLSALQFAERLAAAPESARRGALDLVDAARRRLAYWDVSPQQVRQLEESREVLRTLAVVAPASGLVMMRLPGLEGMAVKPGMELFHIADLSSLWLSVEVFEDQLGWLSSGSEATIQLSYFPGETFRGRVRYVEPQVAEKTRTVGLRLEVPNPSGRLRAGMYATVVFSPVVRHDVVAVPSLAVLRTGERNLVVVESGPGRFEPRVVELGVEGDGFVEVRSGLSAGEQLVTSSQFLIDSESNLREAIQKLLASRRSAAEASHAE